MEHQDCAVDLSKPTDMTSAVASSPSVTDEKTTKMTMNTYLPIKMKYYKSCNSDARTKQKIIQDFEKNESSDSKDDKIQTGLSESKKGTSLLPRNGSISLSARQHKHMTFQNNFPMSECMNSSYKTLNSRSPGSNLPRDTEACSTKTRAFKRKFKSRVMSVVNSLYSSDSNDSCNEEKYHTSRESASNSIEGNTKNEAEDLSGKGSSSTENTDHYFSDTEDHQDYLKKAQEQKKIGETKDKIKMDSDESRLSEDKALFRSLKMKTAESASSSLNSAIEDTCASHRPFSGIVNYCEMAKFDGVLGNQQAKAYCNKRNEDNSQPGPSQDTEMQNDVLTKKFLDICKAYVEGWSTTFTCTLCNQMFSNKEGLQDHMRYHLREDPQFCSLTKDTPKNSKKTWKPRAESKRLHRCHICMKTLTRNWDLQRHIRTHSEPKGTVNFICELCGSGFSDKANYKRHRQMDKQIKQTGSINEQDQIMDENGQGKILEKHDYDQTVLENGQGQSDNSSCDLMQNHDQTKDEHFKVQD
ncbi:hypothetical protein ACJMK2_015579 [Sinanodonta woodiana]|uniref:C2H2-type domain-containing protein n=1 Tax=Sinanodonta woodiana TaxID=1069815 RepID=A0ABD3US30_SINWO